MKPKIFLTVAALFLLISAFGQKPSIELVFTAVKNADHVQLDSIKVMNQTQGGDTVLLYPDTILVLNYQVGISEDDMGNNRFRVFRNYPNPVSDQTTLSFYIPERGKVNLTVSDLPGRALVSAERILDHGYHAYRFIPGNGNVFIVTVKWRKKSNSIKVLKTNSASGEGSRIVYAGSTAPPPELKANKSDRGFPYSPGDKLLYIGNYDTLQSGMQDAPEGNETYTFQFATNVPCLGTPTVQYEGQVYNTVQIAGQCWLKENLNVGTMVQGMVDMTDNGIIEKYCCENEPDSCDIYGGLYQWDEMMQYSLQQGAQGICPPGWHLPTDEEWKMLEGAADSQYGIGHDEWNGYGYRGEDAGGRLKSENGWNYNGNGTDVFGFSALPGGERNPNGSFNYVGLLSPWWSSSKNWATTAWGRNLDVSYTLAGRNDYNKQAGFGVRCVRDD